MPTLVLLLLYITCRHPDAKFLRPFNAWCSLVLVLYACGLLFDLLEMVDATQRNAWHRFIDLAQDAISLLLFGNIVYFNVLLLRRISPASAEAEAEKAPQKVEAPQTFETEYERQRAGLEAVRQAAEARLAAMEGEKARAVDMVGEAMESLEVLSNELHEAGQGGGGGGGEGGSERPRADSTSVVETQHL